MTNSISPHTATALLGLALESVPTAQTCMTPLKLAAWHDGTLSASTAGAVQRHVSRCDRCRVLWLGIVQTQAPARSTDAPSLWWRLVQRLAPTPHYAIAAVAVIGVAMLSAAYLRAPALPDYAMEVSGASKTFRSNQSGHTSSAYADGITVNYGNRFELNLHPEERHFADIMVSVYLFDTYGNATHVPIEEFDVADGTVRIRGVVGQEIAFPPGQWALVPIVGVNGRIPKPATIWRRVKHDSSAKGRHWMAWHIPLVVLAGDRR